MSFWKKCRKLHIWLAVDLAVLGLYLALRQNRQLMNSFADHVTTLLKAALGRCARLPACPSWKSCMLWRRWGLWHIPSGQ